MRRTAAGAGLLAALTLVAAAPASPAAPRYELRRVDLSSYPLVRLVVRSSRGAPAPVPYADGRRVHGADVENLGGAKAVVLAIDRSQSMRGTPLARATDAAAGFLRRKRSADEVAIVSFGPRSLAQTTFARATIDADNALSSLSTASRPGTALWDAVVLSASQLRKQGLLGRVLVLLTDGRDVGSVATLADAVRAVQRAKVVVYAIALGHADRAPLGRLAHASGGSLYGAATSDVLAAVYGRIARELSRTWSVSFPTSARPGDTLTLSLGRTGARVPVVVPGPRVSVSGSWLPSRLVRSPAGVAATALVAAVVVFLVALRLLALPAAERSRRLVLSHTEPRARRARPSRRARLASAVAALDRSLRRGRQWEQLERLVSRAGIPVSASTLLLGGLAAAVACSLLALLLGVSGFGVVLAFVVGFAVPLVAARIVARRRVSAFDDQLPDVLATVASTLRVGHGLKAGLQAVADDGPQPASGELRRVLSEARLGRPLDEALISMCERLGSDDLMYVATAVDVQSRVGGSLAGVFETVAETVRQRQQHRRRVRALTASGRASATVLSLLPFVLVVLVSLVNPHYMLPFLRSGTGHVLILVSLVSISIGALLLARIANVKG
ncbi:MAG TPA: type II secretion system F family protein [Gaiellaceae bacterium]|nr:type II secretion system F family protein [Gaiellaceae bacterium]